MSYDGWGGSETWFALEPVGSPIGGSDESELTSTPHSCQVHAILKS